MLHLSGGPEVTGFQGGTRQTASPGVHALAVRPSSKDAADTDDAPAVRALWAVGRAHRAAAAGPEPLPRLVALPALALAHPLVLAFVPLVPAHDTAPVLVFGHGLGGDHRAREREHPGTRRREPHDAQEGRWAL